MVEGGRVHFVSAARVNDFSLTVLLKDDLSKMIPSKFLRTNPTEPNPRLHFVNASFGCHSFPSSHVQPIIFNLKAKAGDIFKNRLQLEPHLI